MKREEKPSEEDYAGKLLGLLNKYGKDNIDSEEALRELERLLNEMHLNLTEKSPCFKLINRLHNQFKIKNMIDEIFFNKIKEKVYETLFKIKECLRGKSL